jgi:glutamyl endopeptidase
MPPRLHRRASSLDRPAAAPAAPAAAAIEGDVFTGDAFEGTPEVFVEPARQPRLARAEPIVLPDYRSPHELRASREEAAMGGLEAGGPAIAPGPAPRDAAEGSFAATTVLEAVIGNDDRLRLDDDLTRTNPWRQICSLRILAATGSVYVGTGWFIGPRILATAGHCVYMRKDGGWAVSIDVVPGRYGGNEPYGRATAVRFAATQGWIDTGGRDFDYGVIFLADGTLGSRVGNFAVEALPDADLIGITGRISGYPADLDRAAFQYYHERELLTVTQTRIEYDIDTFGGQSGSPIWRQDAAGPAIAVGIHTTGSVTGNSGTRISETVLDNLISWSEES